MTFDEWFSVYERTQYPDECNQTGLKAAWQASRRAALREAADADGYCNKNGYWYISRDAILAIAEKEQ